MPKIYSGTGSGGGIITPLISRVVSSVWTGWETRIAAVPDVNIFTYLVYSSFQNSYYVAIY